ncbi:MAG: hypothetical protein IJV73_00530, partial [Clostridia bacterium]|nr:hypothetical protein [Clostridia bacterium]
EYVERICQNLRRHMVEEERGEKSKLLYTTAIPNAAPVEPLCKKLLQMMLSAPELAPFQKNIKSCFNHYCFGG